MKNNSRILYFIQEIIIVVIGVLIAVSIGKYKEKVDNEKYLEKTLFAIENEISSSRMEIDTVLEKHIQLYTSIKDNMGNDEQSILELITDEGGFQVASIKNISLRFFITNKAELLDFKLISQLLDIELETNILTDKIKRLTDYAYDHMYESKDEVKLKLSLLVAEVIDGEQTLLDSYSSFLEEYKNLLEEQ